LKIAINLINCDAQLLRTVSSKLPIIADCKHQ